MNAFLMAAPYILNAMGGVFGSKKRKYIDPEMIRQKYGPDAIAGDTMRIANAILNSPYGQQLLSQAATSGQQIQSNLASNAAASGMGAGSGASSGVSDFAAATAPQAQAALEGQAKAGVWQSAMPIAAEMNANLARIAERGQAYNNENEGPSTFQKIASAAGQWASTIGGQRARGGSGTASLVAPALTADAAQSDFYRRGQLKKPGEE